MTNPASPESNSGQEQATPTMWYLRYWPAILVGVLLSMGMIGLGGDNVPAFLIWMPPFIAVVLLLIAIISQPREKKPKEMPWEKREREAALLADVPKTEQPGAKAEAKEAAEAPVEAAPEAPAAAPVVAGDVDVLVLWGSETGTAQGLADMTESKLKDAGKTARSVSMGSVKLEQLPGFGKILILTSTWGDGEPPSNAIDLWEAFQKQKVDLSNTGFSVLSLGDTSYPEFCKCGKDFDVFLEKMGAKRIFPRVDCDLDYEANYEKWISGVQKALA